MNELTELARALSGATSGLSAVHLPFLLAGLGFQALGLVLRGVAWRNVLTAAYPASEVSGRRITGAYLAGVAANSVMPAKGGEVLKVALARRYVHGSSTSGVAGTLAVMTVLDLLVGTSIAVSLLWAGAVRGVTPAAFASSLLHPRALVFLLALAMLLLAAVWRSDRLRRGIGRQLAGLWNGLAVLRTPGRYLRTVAVYQLAAWVCRVAVAACLLAAFGLKPTVMVAGVVVIAGSLAGLVPGSPGGVGAEQLLLAYALSGSAATAQIVAFSVGAQLAVIALQVLLGLGAAMLMMRILHPGRAIVALRRAASADA